MRERERERERTCVGISNRGQLRGTKERKLRGNRQMVEEERGTGEREGLAKRKKSIMVNSGSRFYPHEIFFNPSLKLSLVYLTFIVS